MNQEEARNLETKKNEENYTKEQGKAVASGDEDDPVGDIMIDIDGEDLIFSVDDDTFPSLPDFPCLSSPAASPTPSSASNLPKNPSMSISSSSSSSSSWSFLAGGPAKSDMQTVAVAAGAGASDEANIFADINLWDPSNPLDTSFLFPDDYDTNVEQPPELNQQQQQRPLPEEGGDEDLAAIFLDWLKSNRDSISPEDLRSIKLKRSTIECAAARLGGGKQGKTQLLKLILSWVQNHHLQKKRRHHHHHQQQQQQMMMMQQEPPQFHQLHPQYRYPATSESMAPNPNLDYSCEAANNWNMMQVPALPPPPPPPPLPLMVSDAPPPYHYYHQQPFSPVMPGEFHTVHYSSPFPGMGLPRPHPPAPPPQYTMYHHPTSGTFSGNGSASATREARKKRMARQRRVSAMHHNRNLSQGRINGSSHEGGSNSRNWGTSSSSRQKNVVGLTAADMQMKSSRNGSAHSDKREVKFMLCVN